MEGTPQKIEALKEQLQALKKQFAKFEDDVKPTVSDLEYMKGVLENKLDFFEVLKDRNESLERNLSKEISMLEGSFSKRRIGINQPLSTSEISKARIEAQFELEGACRNFNGLIREWKDHIFDQLTEIRSKRELVIKIGNEPRKYIKEMYEKSAKRLYQLDL
ncbi:hypothetical protein G6F46_006927 [Rhizopus delemar]|uniref:Uncharacterized protein n=3 Tax=Rhizopus TaxID=4842 RepID=I1CRH9_RHIO9|nr:hypothetical protein RO3G_15770 [Rhizopus delemar RA 99-880]KAG1459398.1 hypothetical protein G6F55_004785 [Rhizopus delemar]KAG1545820.1 hypothetical protein G6F51_005242 [Rhizopus arrhizus]KAG1496685.1 hypothetical protein G6F54_006301 [Rhizopus delemar]KAG1513208.1 hypothetical protein G6F53_004607 [Rhizopus delemar]|eukprot:EIE91059.1 hypothetical protein RO3G_15770 [Rhizopus delemar RA 99-880]